MDLKKVIGDKDIENAQYELGKKTWPEFMQHDTVVGKYWHSLYRQFLNYQFALYTNEKLLGIGNSVPIYFNSKFSNLPDTGLDWAMEKAVSDYKSAYKPNLLVGVQILINGDAQSKGLSYKFLEVMKQVAKSQGISNLALPVRPIQKHLYPLIPMKDYIKWKNQKGDPFDAWIRVHTKAGGKIIKMCNKSMKIEGSINEWKEWTGMHFQTSGDYIVPKALVPVLANVEQNIAEYTEPNIWISHKID